MTLLYADLSGVPVVRASLVVPAEGPWHADVTLDRSVPVPIAGPQLLTLAGGVWSCTAIRVTDYGGIRMARLVAGLAGWRNLVPFRQYASPAGVTLATVLADLALAAGEAPPVVSPLLPPIVGTAYVRRAGVASLTLQDLLGSTWWVDPTGVVQTAPRDRSPIVSAFATTMVDGPAGAYTIATESPTDWMPGRSWLGPTSSGTVSRVRHVLEAGSLRTEVMAA